MKKLLLFFALLPILARGQGLPLVINGDTIATRAWVRSQQGTVKPTPIIPACEYGPDILETSGATNKSVTALFSAKGAYKVSARVVKGADTLVALSFKPESNRVIIPFGRSLSAGDYTLLFRGDSCRSTYWSPKTFTIPKDEGEVTPPPVPSSADQVGAYTTRFGQRTATHTKSPGIVLAYHNDGTISDVTPGLLFDGKTNVINGKRRYYQFDAAYFIDYDGRYNRFQHIELPDGIFRVIAYDVPGDLVPDQQSFMKQTGNGSDNQGGYPNLITADNSVFHHVDIQINSKEKIGNSAVPSWLIVSRKMLFPKYCVEKDWKGYGKWFATETMNWGDTKEQYNKLGVNTDRVGRMSFSTDMYPKNEGDRYKDEAWMRALGAGVAARQGSDPQSIWTDEFPENMGYPIMPYMKNYHRGIYEGLVNSTGIKDLNQFGIFGTYGDEKTISKYTMRSQGKENFIRSLSTDAQNTYQYGGNGWIGRDEYYNGAQQFRHVNKKIYMSCFPDNYPVAALYNNERLQVGSNEYGGRRLMVYSGPFYEDLNNQWRPVVLSFSGSIIPYAGGEITAQTGEYDTSSPAEHFLMTYYYSLLGSGSALWNQPGLKLGSDSTRLWSNGFDKSITWTRKGGQPEPYISGKNGAPIRDEVDGMRGVSIRNYSSPTDATMAAMDLIWSIRNRITDLYLSSYTSNLIGTYTPKGGTLGTRLNGVGKALNKNFFDLWDIMEQGLGLAIVGEGSEGKVITYYNGYLSPHLFEWVTIQGHTFKSYGRQVYQYKL